MILFYTGDQNKRLPGWIKPGKNYDVTTNIGLKSLDVWVCGIYTSYYSIDSFMRDWKLPEDIS